jgi:hypothetical protein
LIFFQVSISQKNNKNSKMKKIAIFVEGDTEFYFVEKLVHEIAGYGKIRLVMSKQHGGSIHFVRSSGAPEDVALLEIALTNCCGDGKVKSFILERKEKLANEGYSYIIGLQDLFPLQLADLDKFEEELSKGLDASTVPIRICIAVKEIEAWFLNEAKHFEVIDPTLTNQRIIEGTGFDPASGDAETSVKHPAFLLDKIYKLASLKYKKHSNEIHRLIAALDFFELYNNVRNTSKSLDKFLREIDSVLHMEVGADDLQAG